MKKESAVQGWERVRTLYQPEDPNSAQPAYGRMKKGKYCKIKRKNPPVQHYQTQGRQDRFIAILRARCTKVLRY